MLPHDPCHPDALPARALAWRWWFSLVVTEEKSLSLASEQQSSATVRIHDNISNNLRHSE